MRELLRLFPKPSHYAGAEEGLCLKDPLEVDLHIALAFPDTYEVGMSYLGQKILYSIVNSHPRWHAERVMAPEREAAQILRDKNTPLATIESDTPLKDLHAVCFSVTHELCYTDILHMLDLAQIPLRTVDRPENLLECPVIMAGGGAMMGAEPLAPFIDLAALGDGEEMFPEILDLLSRCVRDGIGRSEFLKMAASINGVYIPSLFEEDAQGHLRPLIPDYRPCRRIVADLDSAAYPVEQVVPAGAIHNRLSLEIARGCTRGCRFCHAGFIYRPVRERRTETLRNLLEQCLEKTGFEEVSFLALSAGDYSALQNLYNQTFDRCAAEQITLALPSLRVGSITDDIMARMSTLRRTGITLAPEAGSQRLRDVINKGITEEQLLEHALMLARNGWRQVKLYFMIGLPGETDEDLRDIVALCEKVRDVGGKNARLQVTAGISTFVPKPFTPFQWQPQIEPGEIERRIKLLRELFKSRKFLKMRWHEPQVSYLEGILSRGDRKLADVVEKAYRNGAVYCSWTEDFSLRPWLDALAFYGIDPAKYTGGRELDAVLPWSHLESGVSVEFLKRERDKAMAGLVTEDCRYGACGNCGVCDMGSRKSRLAWRKNETCRQRLVFDKRDQLVQKNENTEALGRPVPPQINRDLTIKAAYYKIWHKKTGNYRFISQLELQGLLIRAMRKAKIPVAFSSGFHPLPLLSFGRALPVGVESSCEWFSLILHEPMSMEVIKDQLNAVLPEDMRVFKVVQVEKATRNQQAIQEEFALKAAVGDLNWVNDHFERFGAMSEAPWTYTSGRGEKTVNIRPFVLDWRLDATKEIFYFTADWSKSYISPLKLLNGILGDTFENLVNNRDFSMRKTRQKFAARAEAE